MVPSVHNNNNNNNNNSRLPANGAHAHVTEKRQAPLQVAHHGALAAVAVVGGVVAAGGVALAARGARGGRGHGQQADAALRGQDRPRTPFRPPPSGPNGNSPLRPTATVRIGGP